MNVVAIFFAIAGAIIILGWLGEWIFSKTNIPDPVWLMIFGIVLGRFYNVWDSPAMLQIGIMFTTFALIFLLFEGVLNTDLKTVLPGLINGGNLTFVSFVFTVAGVTGAMMIFGWGFLESLLLGIIVSDVAQAVILPLLKKITISPLAATTITFESAFSDVLGIVGAVTVINIILMKSFTVQEVLAKILYSFLPAIAVGLIGGLLWAKLHERMDRFSKSYITTIGALLLLYGLVEYLGANGSLACLAFGLVIANSKEIFSFLSAKPSEGMQSPEKFFYSEISFFVQSFFFVYLGLLLNLNEPVLMILGFLLTLLMFVIRPMAVAITQRKTNLDEKSKSYLQILIPKGTSAAVLAMLPLQYGLLHAKDFSTIALAVIMFSILFTIIFVFFTERGIFHGMDRLLSLRRKPAPVNPLVPAKSARAK